MLWNILPSLCMFAFSAVNVYILWMNAMYSSAAPSCNVEAVCATAVCRHTDSASPRFLTCNTGYMVRGDTCHMNIFGCVPSLAGYRIHSSSLAPGQTCAAVVARRGVNLSLSLCTPWSWEVIPLEKVLTFPSGTEGSDHPTS